MEADTKLSIIFFILCFMILLSFIQMNRTAKFKSAVEEYIDESSLLTDIYDQCDQEQNITISTIKGRNVNLEKINDTCVLTARTKR